MKEWMDRLPPIPSLFLFENPYLINVHQFSPRTQWVKLDSMRLGERRSEGGRNISLVSKYMHLGEGYPGIGVIVAEFMMVNIWHWGPKGTQSQEKKSCRSQA